MQRPASAQSHGGVFHWSARTAQANIAQTSTAPDQQGAGPGIIATTPRVCRQKGLKGRALHPFQLCTCQTCGGHNRTKTVGSAALCKGAGQRTRTWQQDFGSLPHGLWNLFTLTRVRFGRHGADYDFRGQQGRPPDESPTSRLRAYIYKSPSVGQITAPILKLQAQEAAA